MEEIQGRVSPGVQPWIGMSGKRPRRVKCPQKAEESPEIGKETERWDRMLPSKTVTGSKTEQTRIASHCIQVPGLELGVEGKSGFPY